MKDETNYSNQTGSTFDKINRVESNEILNAYFESILLKNN
jgi:hypothetical protein